MGIENILFYLYSINKFFTSVKVLVGDATELYLKCYQLYIAKSRYACGLPARAVFIAQQNPLRAVSNAKNLSPFAMTDEGITVHIMYIFPDFSYQMHKIRFRYDQRVRTLH